MILYTSESDEYISSAVYQDLESAQWDLEILGYSKDSETYFFRGIGQDIKTALIYKVIPSGVKTVEVKGKTYTFKQLSEETGLKAVCLRERYNRGFRDDELIKPARNFNGKSRALIYDGKKYKSVKECAEKNQPNWKSSSVQNWLRVAEASLFTKPPNFWRKIIDRYIYHRGRTARERQTQNHTHRTHLHAT